MRKLLLVDTNVSSFPIYEYLLNAGNEVYVVGGNPNDFLARTVKNYINMDYSNVDALIGLIDRLDIDYIVPGCNDLSYQVCAMINEVRDFCGIDTVEATETINNKEKFRKFATEYGLPVPRVYEAGQRIEPGTSVIVKPVDAFSGRGMTVVDAHTQDQLSAALEMARSYSRSNRCLIEEYVSGQLYSHSAFVAGGEIVEDVIVEEHGTANPFVVDTSRVAFEFPAELLKQIRASIIQIAKKLKLQDGLIHTQFIQNQDKLWIIEITRRCPGDLYSLLIEYSTGIKYAEMYARTFINERICSGNKAKQKNWVMRHTVSQAFESLFKSMNFNYPIHICKYIPMALPGDLIKPSPFSRLALIFVRCDSENELLNVFDDTLNRKLYEIV